MFERVVGTCIAARPPQGVGEVVLAPVAPAIAQALLHAIRRLAVDRLIEEESKGLQLPLDVPAPGRKKS